MFRYLCVVVLVGMAKELPVADMEKRLLADIRINGDAMRGLAVQRGVAVKDYLASRSLPAGKVVSGRRKSSAPEGQMDTAGRTFADRQLNRRK